MDSNDLLKQLQDNKGALLRLMNSPDGQKLVQMMRQQAGSNGLKQAAGAAAKGDTTQITQMIQHLMATPDGAQVVERINQAMKK